MLSNIGMNLKLNVGVAGRWCVMGLAVAMAGLVCVRPSAVRAFLMVNRCENQQSYEAARWFGFGGRGKRNSSRNHRKRFGRERPGRGCVGERRG